MKNLQDTYDEDDGDKQRIGQRCLEAPAKGHAEFKGKNTEDDAEVGRIKQFIHAWCAVLSIYFAAGWSVAQTRR